MLKIGVVSPFMPHEVADLLDSLSRERLRAIRGVPAPSVTVLVRGWHERGHHLSVFCLDPSVTAPQVLRGERLVIHMLPKRRARHYLIDYYRAERRFIREAVRQEAPDVLSAQWSYDHSLGALECGLPTVVTCHDTPLRYAWVGRNFFMTYHVAVAWHVFRRADWLVCVSPYTARHIQRYFRPRCPVEAIPNGLLPEIFVRGERRLGQQVPPERPLTICSVGGWGSTKNIATLLQAFPRVRERYPAARLELFGRELGPDQAAEQWARQRNLHHGVIFRGSTPHEGILDFLETHADLMVHPSLVEANPLVLMEAMACGVAVIAGRHSGGVAWTLDEGRCGFLCDIRNPRALAETIIAALADPTGLRALVERAWHSTKTRFNLEQAVSANETILRRLCEE